MIFTTILRSCRSASTMVLATLFLSGSLSEVNAQENQEGMGQRPVITFTSWTGPYMRSQMLGFVRPYERANNLRVNVEHYNGGIAEIRDQVESANVTWDVVDLTQADSLRACKEGLLENLASRQGIWWPRQACSLA
ncbi:MAG: hypothetical protein OXF88_18810 [Rhodobacteraceae bacterium]|nr:hypothetical protein [Paracoccaceae bacterium]